MSWTLARTLTNPDLDMGCQVGFDWYKICFNDLQHVIVNGEDKCSVNSGIGKNQKMSLSWLEDQLELVLSLFAWTELACTVQQDVGHLGRSPRLDEDRPILKTASMIPIRHQYWSECIVAIIIRRGRTVDCQWTIQAITYIISERQSPSWSSIGCI